MTHEFELLPNESIVTIRCIVPWPVEKIKSVSVGDSKGNVRRGHLLEIVEEYKKLTKTEYVKCFGLPDKECPFSTDYPDFPNLCNSLKPSDPCPVCGELG
jgi:hypothetical protein